MTTVDGGRWMPGATTKAAIQIMAATGLAITIGDQLSFGATTGRSSP